MEDIQFDGFIRVDGYTYGPEGDVVTIGCHSHLGNTKLVITLPYGGWRRIQGGFSSERGSILIAHQTVPNLPPIEPVKHKPAASKPTKRWAKLAMTATERILTKIKP